eukprot:4832381-Pleurochrysis_carterae.AAC.1
MRGEHSQSESKVRVLWKARLAEEKSEGYLPPYRAARTGSKRGAWSRERDGRGSGRGLRAPLRGACMDAGA